MVQDFVDDPVNRGQCPARLAAQRPIDSSVCGSTELIDMSKSLSRLEMWALFPTFDSVWLQIKPTVHCLSVAPL